VQGWVCSVIVRQIITMLSLIPNRKSIQMGWNAFISTGDTRERK
jgi:hypothetical protein